MKLKSNPQLISLILIIISLHNVNSVDIQCEFKNDDFDAIINQYTCSVQVNLMITAKNTEIQAVRGSHKFGKNSDDVTGLSIRDKKLQYMPSNLADKFKNLVAMRIRQGKLKEVSQTDFKPFPKLRYLNLDANDLEVLDDDLFEFNPLLEVIWFEGNKIKAVGASTFENLRNLRDLDMNGNVCYSKRMSSKYDMSNNMATMKQKCYNSDAELRKLKVIYKELNKNNTKLILDIDELKGQISEKDVEIQRLNSTARNLILQIATNRQEFNVKLVKFNQTKEQLEEQQTKSNLLESQLQQSNLKNHEIIEQMSQLEAKYQATVNQTAENEEKLQAEVEDLQQRINDKELELRTLNQTNSIQTSKIEKEFNQKIDKLQQNLNEKEEKLQELTSKLTNSQLIANKTQQSLKDLQAQIQNLKNIESELRQNASKIEIRFDTREIEVDNLTDIIANNTLKILTYEQQINQLKLHINETETKYAETNSERLELSTNLKTISAEKLQMENVLRNLTEQLNKAEEELRNLEVINDELSSELVNQTQIAEVMRRGDHAQAGGESLVIFGLAVMVLLTIVNVYVALKYYRKKTVVLRQIEADDSYCDDM